MRRDLSGHAIGDHPLDLAGFREPSGGLFGVNQLFVQLDLEHAATPLDELGFDAELIPNRVRQTGGPRKVVSNNTVFNGKAM